LLTFHKNLHLQAALPLSPCSRRAVVDSPPDGFLGVRTARRCHGLCGLFPIPSKEQDMTTNQTGTVKWFNESKGYGFISPDGGGKDLFAHFREIRTEGYKTLAENARVQFDVAEGPKGLQAANIRPMA